MNRIAIRTLGLTLFLILGVPVGASGDYVRDEIRINMRTGPGLQYRILKGLSSGDQVRKLAVQDGWIQVRTGDGTDGWVPSGYLSKAAPPSVALPATEAKLNEAETAIDELERTIADQSEAVTELTSLRGQVDQLSTENIRLSGATRWKDLLTGAALLGLGVIVGISVPRGGNARARKIKL